MPATMNDRQHAVASSFVCRDRELLSLLDGTELQQEKPTATADLKRTRRRLRRTFNMSSSDAKPAGLRIALRADVYSRMSIQDPTICID